MIFITTTEKSEKKSEFEIKFPFPMSFSGREDVREMEISFKAITESAIHHLRKKLFKPPENSQKSHQFRLSFSPNLKATFHIYTIKRIHVIQIKP